MSSTPEKLPLAPTGARAALKATRVEPGARKSSRSTAHNTASPCRPPDRFCRGRPPSMICSAPKSICEAIGRRGSAASAARKAGNTRAGAAASLSSSRAMNLSASSWRADIAACSSGEVPKRASPVPTSFSARSSLP